MPGVGVITVADDPRPTVDRLVAVARQAGREQTTRRTIHGWVKRRLISPPTRVGRQYLYPLAALGEVDSLLRWRDHDLTPELRIFARYIEAGTVDANIQIREVCAELLEAFASGARDAVELAAQGEDVIRREAEVAAKKRGRNTVLPRYVRMSEAERVSAFQFVFAQMLDAVPNPAQEHEGRFQFERLAGLRSGQGGKTRDVGAFMPTREEMQPDFNALRAVVTHASPEALEFSRRAVEICFLWLPASVPLLLRTASAADSATLGVAQEAMSLLNPAMYLGLFTYVLGRTAQSSLTELLSQLDALRPAQMIVEDLEGVPPRDVNIILSRLRPYQAAQLRQALVRRRAVRLGDA